MGHLFRNAIFRCRLPPNNASGSASSARFVLSQSSRRAQSGCAMTFDELHAIARQLPLNAPDMKRDIATLGAALSSYVGKIPAALAVLEQSSAGEAERAELEQHCGAAILILFSVIENFDLSLDAAIQAGARELQ